VVPFAFVFMLWFSRVEEVHVRRLTRRAAACALCVTVALGAAAVPCAAGETAAKAGPTLTRLSPESQRLLASGTRATARQGQAAAPSAPSSFFKSTRGKVTLALMGAGVGFSIWSINHDRKPVKSPIR
jgi:hypothetical protein